MKLVTFNRAMRGVPNPALVPDDVAAAAYARGELDRAPDDDPRMNPVQSAPKPQTYLTKAARKLRSGAAIAGVVALLLASSLCGGVRAQTTSPASTLTLPAVTTAYTAGQLIGSNATAASLVVPSFSLSNTLGSPVISMVHLSTNDTTSTAWGGQTIQVDMWSAPPTFTNGDRGTWSPATGTGSHLGSFSCVMSAEYGDGAYADCAPSVGNFRSPNSKAFPTIYWTLDAITGSGLTAASKTFTLVPEVLN